MALQFLSTKDQAVLDTLNELCLQQHRVVLRKGKNDIDLDVDYNEPVPDVYNKHSTVVLTYEVMQDLCDDADVVWHTLARRLQEKEYIDNLTTLRGNLVERP